MRYILINSVKAMVASTLLLFALVACTTSEQIKSGSELFADQKKQIQAAWVVLGEEGQPIARVITTALVCPFLQQDDMKTNMHVRAQPATIAQRDTSLSLKQAKPSDFPVLTCELPLKKGVVAPSVEGIALPISKPAPLKIVVIGDTGCRLKASGEAFQACDESSQWAFSTVAKSAARFVPDLVIHVGDYLYRESPCPKNYPGCAKSPWGYGWDTWQADFFTPAAPLFAVAPWVMARGNHETCARAGQGWWRFLDPRVLQHGRDCNVQSDDAYGDYSPPYAVPLGAGAQLIVFDSSKASGKPLDKSDRAYQIYLNHFKAADRLAKQADFSLFLEHHPILGFEVGRGKLNPRPIRAGNATLQSILQDIHPQRLFDPDVHILLAGHAHLFEAIMFKSDHPAQFVIGNSGSSPDANLPSILPPDTTPFMKAKIAHFTSTNQIGFVTMERASATATDWVIQSRDRNGVLLTTCHVGKLTNECS